MDTVNAVDVGYRWTSFRANVLGQADTLLAPHPLYLGLGLTDTAACSLSSLFRHQLDAKAISDIRIAINQSQPLGNERFYARIA